MHTYKHLVTSGCSFSETYYITPGPYLDWYDRHPYPVTDNNKLSQQIQEDLIGKSNSRINWPAILGNELDIELDNVHNYAMQRHGNGMIARHIIHKVTDLLEEGVNPSNILVGAMWSLIERLEFFSTEVKQYPEDPTNPINYLPVWPDKNGNWVIIHPHCLEESPAWTKTKQMYSAFDETVHCYIQSLEHVHRVQSFLKLNNIDYFFTTMHSTEGITSVNRYPDNPQVTDIFRLIDFAPFITSIDEFQQERVHPNTYTSYHYTHEHILPHLESR